MSLSITFLLVIFSPTFPVLLTPNISPAHKLMAGHTFTSVCCRPSAACCDPQYKEAGGVRTLVLVKVVGGGFGVS